MTTSVDEARVRDMLHALQPTIAEIIPKALKKPDHVILAVDPTSELVTSDQNPAVRAGWIMFTGTKPVAVLMDLERADRMLGYLEDVEPSVASGRRRLNDPVPPGHVRILVNCGSTVGVIFAKVETRDPTKAPAMFKANGPGEESWSVNALGAMMLYYRSETGDFKAGQGQARHRRFKERVDGVLAGESIKVIPRSLEEVLWQDFGGAELERDIGRRGADAISTWLDRVTGAPS
jgi:hypothetical protein